MTWTNEKPKEPGWYWQKIEGKPPRLIYFSENWAMHRIKGTFGGVSVALVSNQGEFMKIEVPKTCEWQEGAGWDTECGGVFEITDGTPGDNGMKFCCYCGGKIIEKVEVPK